jgi:hypothetical protein
MRLALALGALGLALISSFPGKAGTAKPADAPTTKQQKPKLRIIVFGAHPDDAELKAGGTAAKWSKLGHEVKLVSVTNGDIGHWKEAGGPLAKRRLAEVIAADKVLGVTPQVLDIHDGELEPTLENRKKITRLIREWKADIVSPTVPGTITRIIAMSACWCRMPRSWWPCHTSARTRRP